MRKNITARSVTSEKEASATWFFFLLFPEGQDSEEGRRPNKRSVRKIRIHGKER